MIRPCISLIILVLLLLWLIQIYNRFVQLKNQVDTAWSDISVQLKRRHDPIPKLVDMVRQYARYEETLLERITTLRSEGKKLDAMSRIWKKAVRLKRTCPNSLITCLFWRRIIPI